MAWLAAHATLLLTIWGTVWVLATCLQSTFPPNSAAWKAVHVVLAVSPLDVIKGWKAIGGALVPPVATLALLAFVGLSACAPAPASPPTLNDRAIARAAVSLLEDAWIASAKGCIAVATEQQDDAVRSRCEKVLTPARASLIMASEALDTWSAVDQKNYPCLVTSAAGAIAQVTQLPGIQLPPLVTDGLNIAQTYAGACK